MTEVMKIQCSKIRAGDNDRTIFPANSLRELADSIRENGGRLIQPITVRPISDPQYCFEYEIVAGERRFRAVSEVLYYDTIDAIVRDLTDEEASAIMLIENVHREDLNPLDEARGYQKRITQFGWTVLELSHKANVGTRKIEARLSLLQLVPEVQQLIASGQMPISFGEAMCQLDTNRQRIAMQYVVHNERPLLRVFREIVGKLLAEQSQESMFDINSLFQMAVQAADDKHEEKFNRKYPVAELPAVERHGSLGLTLETYLVKLLRSGDFYAASVVGRVYNDLVEIGMCHPPKEGSPLQSAMVPAEFPDLIIAPAMASGDRFKNAEL